MTTIFIIYQIKEVRRKIVCKDRDDGVKKRKFKKKPEEEWEYSA